MATALTTTKLLAWINASTGTSVVFAATPVSADIALLQQCIDSADANLTAYCTFPATYPAQVEQAVLMLAARLWDRRKTPNGISAGDYGVVRVGSYDADIEALVGPYKTWSFGR